jgi:hypothetical protein
VSRTNALKTLCVRGTIAVGSLSVGNTSRFNRIPPAPNIISGVRKEKSSVDIIVSILIIGNRPMRWRVISFL